MQTILQSWYGIYFFCGVFDCIYPLDLNDLCGWGLEKPMTSSWLYTLLTVYAPLDCVLPPWLCTAPLTVESPLACDLYYDLCGWGLEIPMTSSWLSSDCTVSTLLLLRNFRLCRKISYFLIIVIKEENKKVIIVRNDIFYKGNNCS